MTVQASVAKATPNLTNHGGRAAASGGVARRQARYEQAARLRAAGIHHLYCQADRAERKTIRARLRAAGAPLWRKPPRAGVLGPYRDHLERRWAEGCHNAAQLWRELVSLGFSGRPRQTVRMLMTDMDALPEAERSFISHLLTQAPGLADCIAVAKRLNTLLRRQSEESLEAVLTDPATTALKEFASAVMGPWSSSSECIHSPFRASARDRQSYGRTWVTTD